MLTKIIGDGQRMRKYPTSKFRAHKKGVKCDNAHNEFRLIPFHKGEYFLRYHTLNQYHDVWWVVFQNFSSKLQLERDYF
jgi:hypothetical protein